MCNVIIRGIQTHIIFSEDFKVPPEVTYLDNIVRSDPLIFVVQGKDRLGRYLKIGIPPSFDLLESSYGIPEGIITLLSSIREETSPN